MSDAKYYVNLESVVEAVQLKLDTDVAEFHKLLDSSEGLHDFAAQVRFLQEIQASVRSIDVILGRTTVDGQTIEATSDSTVGRLTSDLESTWGTSEFQGTSPATPEMENSVERALNDQAPRTTEIPRFLTARETEASSQE